MLYVVALIIPPLAILLAGKLGQAVLNLILCFVSVALMLFGIGFLIHIAPVVWAIVVVHGKKSNERDERMAQMIAAASRKD